MTALRYLGRVASICGNRIALVDVATPIPVGLRIVADDDRQGRSPRAGRTTVVEGPEVTVDDATAAGIVAGDYLFEAPPTEAELLERRIAALEAAAFPKWARERFATSVDGEATPASANPWRARAEALARYVLSCDDETAAGARHIVIGNCVGYVWEPDGPRPVESRPGRPGEADRVRAALLDACEAGHDELLIRALADALRAVEGR